MKDATKARQMDERTNRILKITQAIDQVVGPLKPMMERLQALNEWRHSDAARSALTAERLLSPLSSVSVVTDQKPLRASGCQTPERTGLPMPSEQPTPQKADTTTTSKVSGSSISNYEEEKQRTTNLERAVKAAMESIYESSGRRATLDELIRFLVKSDETAFILGEVGDGVAWVNTKGERSTTGRRGIQKHWKKYAMTR